MTRRTFAGFRVLTFDIVGTLIDFETGLTACLAGIAAEAGVTLDPEEALALYGAARRSPDALLFPDDMRRVYPLIAPRLGLPPDAAHAERLRASAADWPAFPDTAEALTRLAARYRLVAMTNAQRWAADHFEPKLGAPFLRVFTTDDTGTEKPDPAYFHAVLDWLAGEGVARHEILHVAQSQYHDIGIAKRLGLATCWIERRHGRPGYGGTIAPDAFTEPDHHFTSLAALADAVGRDMAEAPAPPC